MFRKYQMLYIIFTPGWNYLEGIKINRNRKIMCREAADGGSKKEGCISNRDTTTAFFMDGKDCLSTFINAIPVFTRQPGASACLIHPVNPVKVLYKPHKCCLP
jgi:hypothetical protein